MADRKPNEAAGERLQAVLAAYGADPARWPESDRALESLLSTINTEVLEEARSLDAALARASRPAAPAEAADRLLARVDETSDVVVPFARRGVAPPRQRTAMRGRLATMTALAASLALGVYLGATGQTDWLAPQLNAEEAPEYMTAELDVLDSTLQLFEDHTDP